ncbi:MAG: GntR family transcriptional regulator [Clostridiaceae bacterium]|jgi:GntR family transcriptional regulator|nr:GntR family transcriptional regulator [Clostridiaceae bacterium]
MPEDAVKDNVLNTRNSVENRPIYQLIAEAIQADIGSGKLPEHTRLPSIRKMAEQYGVSVGTIRHVYSLLNRDGVIVSRRGQGTFVAGTLADEPMKSRKTRALKAIDDMLSEMTELGFSMREAQIFFELRLRQKEDERRPVRLALIASTPEERSVMDRALESLSMTMRFWMSYEDVLASPDRLNSGYDFLVAPNELYRELSLLAQDEEMILPVALQPDGGAMAACLSVKAGERVGFMTVSEGFLFLMKQALLPYFPESCLITGIHLREQNGIEDFIKQQDWLMLAPEVSDFAQPSVMKLVREWSLLGGRVVRTRFECDEGSTLYVRRAVEKRYKELRDVRRSE